MAVTTSHNIHLDDDTDIQAHVIGTTYWLALEEEVAIFFPDENSIHDMMSALSLLADLIADTQK